MGNGEQNPSLRQLSKSQRDSKQEAGLRHAHIRAHTRFLSHTSTHNTDTHAQGHTHTTVTHRALYTQPYTQSLSTPHTYTSCHTVTPHTYSLTHRASCTCTPIHIQMQTFTYIYTFTHPTHSTTLTLTLTSSLSHILRISHTYRQHLSYTYSLSQLLIYALSPTQSHSHTQSPPL